MPHKEVADELARFDETFPPYVPFGSRTLSQGAIGTDVAVLQSLYNLFVDTMNPPEGPIGSAIPITGSFGPPTYTAVNNIQSYFGLAVDGVAGPQTFFALGQGVGPETTYGGPVYGSRSLTLGSQGGDVLILQNRLSTFRYAALIGHPANGVFDEGTASAVLAFKADAATAGDTGFPPNAIAGFGFYDATWLYTFAGGRAIFSGRNGIDVVFLQAVLQRLHLYTGPIDGYYNAATVAAVTTFQTQAGITVDGVVGPETFRAIGLQNAVPAPSPLPTAWPMPTPPPPPPPPVACINGVDNNQDMAGITTCLLNQGYKFVLRYLGGPCYQGVVLTRTEAAALTAAGLLIGSIYSGANQVAAFTCGVQNTAHGTADGEDAATQAGAVGQPAGTAIYLDLQGDQTSPESAWLAYVEAWVAAVAAAGYPPGVYSSPTQLGIIHSQPWAGSAILYWVAHSIGESMVVPAPCPSSELSYAQLWQYVLSVTVCGQTGVDIDSAENTEGLWSLAAGGI